MNKLTATDITIIICFVLFIILLIVGIAFASVFSIAFSFVIGGIGYAIVDFEDTKQRVEAAEKRKQTKSKINQ